MILDAFKILGISFNVNRYILYKIRSAIAAAASIGLSSLTAAI
ncbi:MAG: hypothetical protein WCB31_09385 [Nitrososphaeraceae archaeon]